MKEKKEFFKDPIKNEIKKQIEKAIKEAEVWEVEIEELSDKVSLISVKLNVPKNK